MNLAGLYSGQLGKGRTAYIDLSGGEPRTWTFEALDDLCGRVGAGLLRRGLRPGDRVGIIAGNTVEYAAVYFGAPRVALATVPLNTRLPAETLEYIAADAALKLVITDAANAGRMPASIPSIEMGSPAWDDLVAGAPAPVADVAPEHVAVHMYTSGSTGRPKGVLLSHRSQLFTVEQIAPAFGTDSDDRALVSAPMYHKNAMVATKFSLASGGCIVLLARFDARGYLQAVADHRATNLTGVPTMFALMTAQRDLVATLDLTSVGRALIGSAPLTEALVEQVKGLFPNALVTNGYGTTEAIAVFGNHPQGVRRPAISLGYPLAAVGVRLVDITGNDAGEGELWVRGPGVMNGYHNLPEATAERLTDGWYHTGDVMKKDADGFFYFVGRVDDMFVCGGENVYPGDVERMLERHPGVHQAAVVPVDDDLKGALPVAFVVTEAGAAPTEAALKQFALEHGPAYQHPRAVWFVDELPLAGTAKIDKALLKTQAAARFSR